MDPHKITMSPSSTQEHIDVIATLSSFIMHYEALAVILTAALWAEGRKVAM